MQRQLLRAARSSCLGCTTLSQSTWARQAPSLSQTTRCLSYTVPQRQDIQERKWSTPLAKQLADAISITGPIPLASYMRMCLTGDIGGYYTGLKEEGRDQFGRKGDFVTSPEISQIFGELIGIWFVAEWMSQGRPSKGVELLELGPGRGTLMDDILRTIQNFEPFAQSVESIYLVEASSNLREAQKKLLCGPETPMTESKTGYHAVSKYGIPITWTESMKVLPNKPENMPLMVAHEFFDALPIHAFQSVKAAPQQPESPPPSPGPASQASNLATSAPDLPKSSPASSKTGTAGDKPPSPTFEWRELVVSPTPDGSTHISLNTPKSEQHGPVPDFQLTLSPSPTRHARYVPESSPRYRALKSIPDAIAEICPDASSYAADLASRIGGSSSDPKPHPSGAALILDYGTADTVPVNSLRGIRHHRRVNPFSEPGFVDLSIDVDFAAVAESAINASPGVEVHGPVEQAAFLGQMGVRERAEALCKNPDLPTGRAEEIDKSWKRLVDRGPGGMGKVYKAMAIVPENSGKRRPVGFGGDV